MVTQRVTFKVERPKWQFPGFSSDLFILLPLSGTSFPSFVPPASAIPPAKYFSVSPTGALGARVGSALYCPPHPPPHFRPSFPRGASGLQCQLPALNSY